MAEQAQLLGAGRAILLQLAHPLVAAGVADHSSFQTDPLGRLQRTLNMMLTIVFGDRAQAEGMLRQFHAVHVPIQGQLPDPAGPFAAGVGYRAQDQALKLWVHATLMDTGLLVYERFVRPLSPAERDAFYQDSRLLARREGIPESLIPPTLHDFDGYMARMLTSDELTVSATARALAYDVFHPRVWLGLRLAALVSQWVTAGLLPDRLRQAYGLAWSPRHEALLVGLSRVARPAIPLLPAPLRLMPQARAATARLRTGPSSPT
ncbi:MAG: DUF2236 domain-containing protein [Anaerolineae bacterium]|nr:DUF2236 domain-containing protein [Anaerolineae bacterium]